MVYPEVSEKVPVVILIHENRGLNDWARGLLAHVGTLTNLVDNVAKGNTFFFDNIYMKLNDMNTNDIQGFENQIKKG